MYLHESRTAAVILIEIGQATAIPALKGKIIPIDIIEDIVMIQIEHNHIMPVGPYLSRTFFRILYNNLHIRFPVSIRIYPVDNQVALTSINAILVAVNQQAIIHHITFQIPFFHIAIIIQPQDGYIVMSDRLNSIRFPVSIQVQILRFITGWRRRQA